MKRKLLIFTCVFILFASPAILLYALPPDSGCDKSGMTTTVQCSLGVGAATCDKTHSCTGDGHNGWCGHEPAGCYNNSGKLIKCTDCPMP